MNLPTFPVLTGRRLGAYEVQDPIGSGAMGVVYRALDTRLNRGVAIKVLSDELASPLARRRFQLEAEAASSLNHPHILTERSLILSGEHVVVAQDVQPAAAVPDERLHD